MCRASSTIREPFIRGMRQGCRQGGLLQDFGSGAYTNRKTPTARSWGSFSLEKLGHLGVMVYSDSVGRADLPIRGAGTILFQGCEPWPFRLSQSRSSS